MDAAQRKTFQPERVRVQPVADQELVVERIARDDDGTSQLPSVFAAGDTAEHVVLSADAFAARLRTADPSTRPLLLFDQFEELITLFEAARAPELQRRVVELLIALVRSEDLPVKILLVFREDYLARVKQLLEAVPELVDQALRLTPPRAQELTTIIRGPFERFRFAHELKPDLADRLSAKLADRFGSGDVSLTEVQTVCLRLWQSADPEALLESRGIQGLLEDYLGEELGRFPPDLRYAAVALLSEMVTSEGTRSVVSAEDLISRVRDGEELSPTLLHTALERLERDSKLVRRERRREIDLYEITSEFLVPWISERRNELVRLKQARKKRRRRLLIGSFAGLGVIVALLLSVGTWALDQRSAARAAEKEARSAQVQAASLAMAFASGTQLSTRVDAALLLALNGYDLSDRTETRSSMIAALEAALGSQAIVMLRGHDRSVESLAASPDGRFVASGGSDGTIVLWNARTHEKMGAPLSVGSPVWSVAVRPDGLLASAGGDGEVRLWDTATHEERLPPIAGGAKIRSVAFSPGGRFLAVGGEKGRVQLWEVGGRKKIATLSTSPYGGDQVWGLVFSKNGRYLFGASTETCEPTGFSGAEASAYLTIWDVRKHKALRTQEDDGAGCAVAASPDGRMLATSGLGGVVQLWDGTGRKKLGRLVATRHPAAVRSVAFDSTGRLLAAAGFDQDVRLWNVRTRKRFGPTLEGHSGTVDGVAFVPGSRSVVSAGSDGTVRIWASRPLHRLDHPLPGHAQAISGLAVDSATGTVLSGGEDGMVRFWDVETPKELAPPLRASSNRTESGSGSIPDVAVSRDGATIASASEDGSVRLWNALTHEQVGTTMRQGDRVWAVAISPDGRLVASGGPDDRILLWDTATSKHRKLATLRGHADAVRDVAFSPDGETLASASFDHTIRLWNVRTRKPIAVLRGHTGYVFSVAFSPDGSVLASGGDDTVRLWNVRTHRQIGEPLRGHAGYVYRVAFSPDGGMLASAGIDGTVRLWDVEARKPLGRPLRGHHGAVYAVAFAADGDALVSSGKDRTVRIWRGFLWKNKEALRRDVCALVVGNLTRAEWRDFAPGMDRHTTC
jgi:WD40 repeat protein